MRDIFKNCIERLGDQAMDQGHLEMADMADDLELLYDAIPRDMFRKK